MLIAILTLIIQRAQKHTTRVQFVSFNHKFAVELIISSKDLNRYCLPNITDAKTYLMENVSGGNLGKYFVDLATAWYLYLTMGGISLLLCIIYLILFRCAPRPLFYVSFVLIFVLLLGGGFYVWYLGDTYEEKDNTRSVMHGMGILLWILTGLYFIIFLCCFSRIRLGIAIMEAASDFIRSTPHIFFVPFIFFLLLDFGSCSGCSL